LATTRKTGDIAEDLARKHILKEGYRILDTNWRFGHLELDIVALDNNQLVVIEVKSRTGERFEHPSEAVTAAKINRIVEATEAYILLKNIELETRFDVITVVFAGWEVELEHFKDAFYPTV
jgi:putative endonuclease